MFKKELVSPPVLAAMTASLRCSCLMRRYPLLCISSLSPAQSLARYRAVWSWSIMVSVINIVIMVILLNAVTHLQLC